MFYSDGLYVTETERSFVYLVALIDYMLNLRLHYVSIVLQLTWLTTG